VWRARVLRADRRLELIDPHPAQRQRPLQLAQAGLNLRLVPQAAILVLQRQHITGGIGASKPATSGSSGTKLASI
jgi:hypothetical protein